MRHLALAVLGAGLLGCERSEPMQSLSDPCAGERVVTARNSSNRPVELYARQDTIAAVLIGVVPPNGSGEFVLPPPATGVFVFPVRPTGAGAADASARQPLRLSYRCVMGRTRGSAPSA